MTRRNGGRNVKSATLVLWRRRGRIKEIERGAAVLLSCRSDRLQLPLLEPPSLRRSHVFVRHQAEEGGFKRFYRLRMSRIKTIHRQIGGALRVVPVDHFDARIRHHMPG